MIRYAITGNIASGKSRVERIIQEYGYKVLDSDKIGHSLLNSAPVIELFEPYDVFDDGKISRAKLAKLVFDDNKLLKNLENIIHPMIKENIIEFFEKNNNEQRTFVSIPLLFETNMTDIFDKIILVYTNDELRLKRLISRNNYTLEYAKKRIECQQSQDEKISKSDIIIYNNGTEKELRQEVVSKLAL